MATLPRVRRFFAAALLLAPAGALAAPTAVPTFESVGLDWRPTGRAANKEASIRYRPSGSTAWRQGFSLWFDARNSEYRGSLVGLASGTTYEIEASLPGGPVETVSVRTWSELFPIAQTIELPASSSQTLTISQSGTASGYILYTSPPGAISTIDVAGAQANNIVVNNASYVIIRGLRLRGAGQDAIRINGTNAHDLVIEENDISGWGRVSADNFATNYDGAIYSREANLERVIIQRNWMHHPRYDANNWDEYRTSGSTYHPIGSQAIVFFDSKGNHVFRYNTIESDEGHYFNDCMGAGENFSQLGFPNRDSDIYGNYISHCWDDGIESEGANRNVRIWGNFIEKTYVKVAVASTSIGPVYVFRNVVGEARQNDSDPWDTVERGGFLKTKDVEAGGKVYAFHNTILQPAPLAGATYTRGCDSGIGHGGPSVNVTSRNNVFHIYKDWWSAIIDENDDPQSDYDYDLTNGNVPAGHEANGIDGVPLYDAQNGAGEFALAATSPGFDAGQVLSGFNDGYTGSAPDMGAFEAGSAPMEFGRDAYRAGRPPEPDPMPDPDVMPNPSTHGPLLIDAGGAGVVPWVADTYYAGGTAFVNWNGDIDTSGVQHAAPAAIYQSERYGDSTYTISDLASGDYTLRLHFAENYHTGAGQRAFDVRVNGQTVLAHHDVYAAAGAAHRADVQSFTVRPDASGGIEISFVTRIDNAVIMGLELVALTSTAGPNEGPASGEELAAPGGDENRAEDAPGAERGSGRSAVAGSCAAGSGDGSLAALLAVSVLVWWPSRRRRPTTATKAVAMRTRPRALTAS